MHPGKPLSWTANGECLRSSVQDTMNIHLTIDACPGLKRFKNLIYENLAGSRIFLSFYPAVF